MSSHVTRCRTVALTLLVASSPAIVRAENPFLGITSRDCAGVAHEQPDVTRPMLYGLLWTDSSRSDAVVDVLYDETWSGDPSRRLGNTTIVSPGAWQFDNDWRGPETTSLQFDSIVIDEDEIWFDSTHGTWYWDLGLSVNQSIGVVSGRHPEVTTLPTRHAVRWRPIGEVVGEPGGTCSNAGAGFRGAFAGYSVWSLAAAGHPVPTRADFMREGIRYFADLSKVDFGIPDDDGTQGSDLDPTDGLVLINPDGLPDTGDEILELQACPPGGLARWYLVQPVVRGNFMALGGATFGNTGQPCTLVDVTGDGIPDVADIMSDGYHEFSSACGQGLGLLWEGNIATSPEPGRGEDLPLPSECASSLVFDCDRGLRTNASPGGGGPDLYEPSALDRRRVEPLQVRRSESNQVVLGWEETLGGEYAAYVGDLRVLLTGRYEMTPLSPCLAIATDEIAIGAPPGDVYFLVAMIDADGQSSFGRDSFGRERPPQDPCP